MNGWFGVCRRVPESLNATTLLCCGLTAAAREVQHVGTTVHLRLPPCKATIIGTGLNIDPTADPTVVPGKLCVSRVYAMPPETSMWDRKAHGDELSMENARGNGQTALEF